MNDLSSFAADPFDGARLRPPLPAATLPCAHCGGAGERRYVYCVACRAYVNGRYAPISASDERIGRRPSVVTECGHEAYSLPGQIPCPDCGGSGVSSRTARADSAG